MEYKDHLTSEIYDNLDTGMTRPNALIVIISTAGTNINCPMMSEYKYVSKVLNPELKDVVNEEYFIMICELDEKDDIKDESTWPKANPIVCKTEFGMNILRGKLKIALDMPDKMRIVKTKNFNVWVDAKENGYMNMKKWYACEKVFDLSLFRKKQCVMGADLSTKLDLTSLAFEFLIDGKYYIYQHSFLPEEEFNRRVQENKFNFALWKEEGWLTVIPGATIDYDCVRDYIREIEEEFEIQIVEVCYDPAFAHQFVLDLQFEGYTCVEVRQGPLTLTEPTEDFRKCVYDGNMIHTNDGLFNWSMGNAVLANPQRKQNYTMLDKAKSYEKIDPCAASMNAHFRATKVLANTFDFWYVPDI